MLFKATHIEERTKDYKGEDSVYVICQSGMRSKRAAKVMKKKRH